MPEGKQVLMNVLWVHFHVYQGMVGIYGEPSINKFLYDGGFHHEALHLTFQVFRDEAGDVLGRKQPDWRACSQTPSGPASSICAPCST